LIKVIGGKTYGSAFGKLFAACLRSTVDPDGPVDTGLHKVAARLPARAGGRDD